MLEWGREQDGGILLNHAFGRIGMHMDVVRQAAPSELVPKSIGLVRIMVPRQQMPLYRCVRPHSLDDLVSRVGQGSRVVVNITRDQYVAYVALTREIADACDRIQACQLEAPHLCTFEEAEDLADLPVGGMNKSESHGADSIVTVPMGNNVSEAVDSRIEGWGWSGYGHPPL